MFIGVDGCGEGWFSILINRDNQWKTSLYKDIYSFWENNYSAELILIDIPIGLKEKGCQERKCDLEARKILGPGHASSIFPAPCRASIYAQNYKDASNVNSKMTGRKLSLQTWNIVSRIREVNHLLLETNEARSKIRESHPEICFWAFSGYPMSYSKKKPKGILERTELLKSIYPQTESVIKNALSTYKKSKVKIDDILDALVLALTAKMGVNKLNSIPSVCEFDSKTLPMEIVYYPYYELCIVKHNS